MREARAATSVSGVAWKEAGLGQRAYDQDLVAVVGHLRGSGEPLGGESAGEPALEVLGG